MPAHLFWNFLLFDHSDLFHISDFEFRIFLWPLLHSTGHRFTFQMSAAYSAIDRSLENYPEPATFKERVLGKLRGHILCVSDSQETQMNNSFVPVIVPVEMPVGLNHLNSELCWCDPIIEVNEIGEEVVLHRQVSWN